MDQEYLNTKELSQLIRRSPQAIRVMVCRRKIPFVKPDGRLLFIREEIEKWMRAGKGLSFEEYSKGRKSVHSSVSVETSK